MRIMKFSFSPWVQHFNHRQWLISQVNDLFAFYEHMSKNNTLGGYNTINVNGTPLPFVGRQDLIHTARMTYCFALGHLLGRPGCGSLADHGFRCLLDNFYDEQSGGFVSSYDPRARSITDASKRSYGLAFVILASSAGIIAQRPLAHDVFREATFVLEEKFFDPEQGLYSDEWSRDWSTQSKYRGQNSNMHLTEALAYAYFATGDQRYGEMAANIAEYFVNSVARRYEDRIPEHYNETWKPDLEFNRDNREDAYRPYGTLPGHSFEWAKILCQLSSGFKLEREWFLDRARSLVERAWRDAWERDGRAGFIYSVDIKGNTLNCDRYWWVHAEALAALALLSSLFEEISFEKRYRAVWDFLFNSFLDHRYGGWYHVLSPTGNLKSDVWNGKPDLYHALQCYLVALGAEFGGNIFTSCVGRAV